MTDLSATDAFDGKTYCKKAPEAPGVYRMHDLTGDILYIGKAKNLRNRLSSYFSSTAKPVKTVSLVEQIASIEITVTATESEALILEDSLIKKHRPKYNILLRDDKTYPFVHATTQHEYPRLKVFRGRRKKQGGAFFGPYPSAYSVHETISTLQKIFKIRSCDDSYFKHRTRPCLQFQIKRCSAPCVGEIDQAAYQSDFSNALEYLRGNTQVLIGRLVASMDAASVALNFEEAAKLRDQIALLRKMQEQQMVASTYNNVDVLAVAAQGEKFCISILFVRDGRVIGSKAFIPKGRALSNQEALNTFAVQYYLDNDPPTEIILPAAIDDQETLAAVLSERMSRAITLKHSVRGQRLQWRKLALMNADQALAANMGKAQYFESGFKHLREWLGRDDINLIECFDISHSQGERAVASCTCFNVYGAMKERYRHFNISGITPGDDYAAMKQAVFRHFKRLKSEGSLPNLLLIDGGPNQISKAIEALAELDIGFSDIVIVGIAKGPERKLGEEELFINDSRTAVKLPRQHYGLRLLQAVRDEAHRFAVKGHRSRRDKARRVSPLEEIAGLGPKRRQLLLKSFGGLQAIEKGTVEQLASVPGISKALAQKIFLHFNGNS